MKQKFLLLLIFSVGLPILSAPPASASYTIMKVVSVSGSHARYVSMTKNKWAISVCENDIRHENSKLQIQRNSIWKPVNRAVKTFGPLYDSELCSWQNPYFSKFLYSEIQPGTKHYRLVVRTISGKTYFMKFTIKVVKKTVKTGSSTKKTQAYENYYEWFEDAITGDNGSGTWSGCYFKGEYMGGRVKVVDYFADYDVQVVNFGADLRVRESLFGSGCGEWQFVDYNPDFTIRFVSFGADFTIEFVDYFAGR